MKKTYRILTAMLLVTAVSLCFSCGPVDAGRKDGPVDGSGEAEETGGVSGSQNGQEESDDENGADRGQAEVGTRDEFFVNAILKSIDKENNTIVVEQLVNDPDETIIGSEVKLAPDYKVVRVDPGTEDSGQEYTDIAVEDIPPESEIGIMLGGDDRAELIIYQTSEHPGDKEVLKNTVLDFLDAIKAGEEYDYFSSSTVSLVGTEEEYRNGVKSDIYFILNESHTSWEDIDVTQVQIERDMAYVEITGDRMVEGMEYEGDQVTFTLVDEQGTWKLDFSSR